MKKFFLLLLAVSFFIFAPKVSADNNFDITSTSTYTVSEDGTTQIFQKTRIQNKTDYYYTPSYTIQLGLKNVEDIKVYNSNGAIPFVVFDTGDAKKIEITFKERVVGIGQVNEFFFSYNTRDIAKKIGNIWQIDIPGLASPENFTSYSVALQVPKSFGAPSVVKPFRPNLVSRTDSNEYSFTKNDLGNSGAFLLFGDSQYYKLNLSYHIGNSNLFPIKTEVALPPSTNYQEVVISSISPRPDKVYQDADGNWLAYYSLAPQKKINIKAQVIVKLSAQPREQQITDKKAYLVAREYWEVSDSEIQKLGKELKTPAAIYDFVANKLTYNYEKVSEENKRQGAKLSLAKPNFSVCLEFTDLFIAIARAAGIPARAVEGYAYTENSKLRPLSLVKDVLHAWPEYYDETQKAWIMVDPTWGNTTHGLDYFNSLDFSHIAFVKKGIDSSYPVPAGGYKFDADSKDIHVSFAEKSEFNQIKKSMVSSKFPRFSFSPFPIKGTITFINTGNTQISGQNVSVKSTFSDGERVFLVEGLPPYGSYVLPIEFAPTPFYLEKILTNTLHTVTISYGGESHTETILVGFLPQYTIYIVGGVISAIIAISIIAVRPWRIFIPRQK